MIVTGNRQGIINVYQTETKYVLRKYTSHKSQVNSIEFGESKLKLLSCSNDLSIKIWDLQESQPIFELNQAHSDTVKQTLFIDPNESTIISAGYDRLLKLWDIRQANPLIASREHDVTIEAISFGQTNDYVISAFGSAFSIWDLRQMSENTPLMTMKSHLKAILCLSYDKIRNRIITGSADSMIKFTDFQVKINSLK